jgi:ribosomal protein S21
MRVDSAVVPVEGPACLEPALATFRKRLSGTIAEIKRRRFYLSPSAKRRQKAARSRARDRKNAARRAAARAKGGE